MPRLRRKTKDEVDFVITFVAEHHKRNDYMQASKQTKNTKNTRNQKQTKKMTKKFNAAITNNKEAVVEINIKKKMEGQLPSLFLHYVPYKSRLKIQNESAKKPYSRWQDVHSQILLQ
jgi:hypothetical protein